MKRLLIYTFVLLAVGVAAYFLVIRKGWSTLRKDETAFSIEDTSSIAKIFIADMGGNKVVLERQKSRWIINGKYIARPDYTERLLATLKNVTVSYPVPDAAQNTVVREMATHNKKVEVYDSEGKLMKSYYVGGASLDALGTYMLMDGAKKPYVTAYPGFQGVLHTRYATDIEKIRDATIYKFRMNEIKELSLTYPSTPDSGFAITVLGADSFQLGTATDKLASSQNVDKEKVRGYLNYFRALYAEAFVNDLSKKDTILATTPYCSIQLKDRNNELHKVVCYYKPVDQETPMQYDREGNPLPYDTDRYFATINNGNDFVIIQTFHLGKIFRSYTYFLTKSKKSKR